VIFVHIGNADLILNLHSN